MKALYLTEESSLGGAALYFSAGFLFGANSRFGPSGRGTMGVSLSLQLPISTGRISVANLSFEYYIRRHLQSLQQYRIVSPSGAILLVA